MGRYGPAGVLHLNKYCTVDPRGGLTNVDKNKYNLNEPRLDFTNIFYKFLMQFKGLLIFIKIVFSLFSF
jgi:hypothetical protein